MRIRLEDIPDQGTDVAVSQTEGWFFRALSEAAEGEPVEASLTVNVNRITPGSETLRVRGSASASVERPCDRCMTRVCAELSGTIDLYYVPEGHGVGGAELHSDDLDIGWYDAIELDMATVVAEQFALWLPERIRCTDEGVSPQVDDPASHSCEVPAQPEVPDIKPPSPFAGLKLPSGDAEG